MIKDLISIIFFVCFLFQICFIENACAANSDVAGAKEVSENKMQLADDDYCKLLLSYSTPLTALNNSFSYSKLTHGNINQEFSLHPDLKLGKKIKVILKNGTIREGRLQEMTNGFVCVRDGLPQQLQMSDIAEIKFKKKGINGIIGGFVGLAIGAIAGIVHASAAGYTEEGRILSPLLFGGIGAGIGAAVGVFGDGGDPVTIVPVLSEK